AGDLFVSLAEMYDGEHGLAYSTAALDVIPGHDRAMQLAAHYARELGRAGEVPPRWAEYVKANPTGALAEEARREAGPETGSGAKRAPSAPFGGGPVDGVGPPTNEASQSSFRTDQVLRALQ